MASKQTTFKMEDVDKIRAIGEALGTMSALGISAEGSNLTLDKAKLLIKNHISKNGGKAKSGQGAMLWADQDTTSSAMKEDNRQRDALKVIFQSAKEYLRALPEIFQGDLQQMFPHYSQQMINTTEELGQSQCLILVSGEMGSGKSSLVNLLLGRDLLPTSELRCTATIVEIHYGDKPTAIVSYKDDSYGRARSPIKLQCPSMQESESFLREVGQYIVRRQEDTDESPFEKIQIYWPLDMLKGGVVIVDSPGVGDSHILPQQLAAYLERAFGFIYVIDSTCGIHKQRLGQLLYKAIETNDGFDPSTTLFICNRWDQIPTEEHDRAVTAIHDRLSMIISGVKKSQLYPISVQKCKDQVKYSQIHRDHQRLVEDLRRFLPQAMRGKLRRYYRFLSTILKRSLFTLRMSYSKNKQKVEGIRSESESVEQRLGRLQGEATKTLEDMRTDVKRAAFEAGSRLREDLDSMRTQARLLAWHEDDCPKREKSWQTTMKNACLRIAERFAQVINEWDQRYDPVGNLQKDILQKFQKKFDILDKQLKDIERVLCCDETYVQSQSFNQAMKSMTNKGSKTTKSSKGVPALLSIGDAVTAGIIFDPKHNDLKAMFKDKYQNDPNRVMAKASEIFMSQLDNTTVIGAITKFFDRFVKAIDNVAALLPELIKADEALLKQLNQNFNDGQKKLDYFPSISRTAANLQGDLDMFFVQKLMVTDFRADQLIYNPSDRIGKGSFAYVFKGKLKNNGDTLFAIKEPKEKMTIADVTDCLLEESMLREIDNINIVKYYGVCRKGPDTDLRLIMVMEHCPFTLKARCIDNSKAPSSFGVNQDQQDRAILEVCNFLVQICNGLRYLHTKTICHRDLKPDNVLLTSRSEVRIADLGLAKKTRDLVTHGIGTPVYMAPEVLDLFGKYDTQADIYSLAMIMWELWYGRDLAEYAANDIQGGLRTNIERGWRPSCTARAIPPDFWKDLMCSCWERNPLNRPTAQKVGKALAMKMIEIQQSLSAD